MAITKCPGQDTRVWKTQDIFELPCPQCGNQVEFWKDDASQKCSNCGQVVTNPHPVSTVPHSELKESQ